MTIKADRGFVIPAFNTTNIDYEACAHRLRDSILRHHEIDITILTIDDLPETDLKGQALDYYAYRLSPYRQTIKLEADMIITAPCAHWFDMMQRLDVCVSTGCRDLYGNPAISRFYRKFIDNNNLPDVYNAVTYWRVSETAQTFFAWVRRLFVHWNEYKRLVKFPDDEPSTDFVYAMAAQIIGPNKCTMPFSSFPKIIHCKQHILGTLTEDWTKELVWEDNPVRINTVAQWGALHYLNKTWML